MPRCSISSLNCFAPDFDSDRLSNMAALDLCHKNLTTVPADIFRYEKSIEELYLDANQIRELPRVTSFTLPQKWFVSEFMKSCGYSYVTSLFLIYNTIMFWLQILFSLQNLKVLGLSDNELSVLPSAVANLVNLRELDVSKNGKYSSLTWLPCGCICHFQKNNNM